MGWISFTMYQVRRHCLLAVFYCLHVNTDCDALRNRCTLGCRSSVCSVVHVPYIQIKTRLHRSTHSHASPGIPSV
ncbi:hypothetical protein BJ741DRAFT_631353 [Chytriomyces cf. hyalinus JEL632]|nr:hypothetical protein BJ741DRAFT_631353 [Chytriomyces cf. hyalinus JEL632]